MPTYSYFAKDGSGKSIRAREFALSEYELKTRLSRKNLIIISIKEANKTGGASMLGARVKIADLVLFCKQLATMVKGGVPLLRAINSIADELKTPLLRSALGEVSYLIKTGESLSGSLKKFPDIFSNLFVSIVEAGEKTGALDTMLERLSLYLEARDRLNKKIMTALTYPAFVVAFFIFAMAVITLFLIPRFRSLYDGFKAELPLLTRMVFGFSDLIARNMPAVIVITAVAVFFARKFFFRSKRGRRAFDNFILLVPVFGDVIKNAALSKFARTLATLLAQGIPIAASLELVSKTSGNVVIEESGIKIKDLILDGTSIHDAMKKAMIFPPLMLQMVMVGVESGSLPDLLDKTANFYEERVDNFVSALTSMIEPIIIIVLGAVIGIVVVALYLPIFNLSQAVSGTG